MSSNPVEGTGAKNGPGIAERMGMRPDMIVMEIGFDDDVDTQLREAIEACIGEELLDEDADEVVDVVLLWFREGDDDLADTLVDAIGPLADDGFIWLLTPKRGLEYYVRTFRHRRGSFDCRPVTDHDHTARRRLGGHPPRRTKVRWRCEEMIEVGQVAPDFTLRDQNNEEFTLSEFRGKQAVLMIFYPLAFTGICTGELCAVRDDLAAFQNELVQTVTISVDSVFVHKVFSEREGYDFPLLADFWPHGGVAQLYGVFNETTGFANRGTFLIDKDGVVRFSELNQPGDGRDPDGWRAAISAL